MPFFINNIGCIYSFSAINSSLFDKVLFLIPSLCLCALVAELLQKLQYCLWTKSLLINSDMSDQILLYSPISLEISDSRTLLLRTRQQ